MYVNIRNVLLSNPNSTVITLSGNIHNLLGRYNGAHTFGNYLYNDTLLNMKDRICSFVHHYQKGAMFNRALEDTAAHISKVNYPNSLYANACGYQNYIVQFPVITNGYNAVLFTRKLTASYPASIIMK
jgi:hypothetical protein